MKLRFYKDHMGQWTMILHIGDIEEWIDRVILYDECRNDIIKKYQDECKKLNIPLEVEIE